MPDTSERRADLVSEMHALVWEEAALHEVTSQVTDMLGESRSVVHGPWTEGECQSVLIPWHTAGRIELIADVDPPWQLSRATWRPRVTVSGAFFVLAAQDAADLLHDPSRWLVGTSDGHVMLCLTDEGYRHDFAEWAALVGSE